MSKLQIPSLWLHENCGLGLPNETDTSVVIVVSLVLWIGSLLLTLLSQGCLGHLTFHSVF